MWGDGKVYSPRPHLALGLLTLRDFQTKAAPLMHYGATIFQGPYISVHKPDTMHKGTILQWLKIDAT